MAVSPAFGDANFSPRPTGWSRWKPWTWIDWRRRTSVRVAAVPDYGDYSIADLKSLELEVGQWWHFSYDLAGLLHGHLGYVPINLYGTSEYPGGDAKFYYRNDPRVMVYRGALFVKWERRPFGYGKWS